jgi:outer membrane protein assembly factor BamA
MRWVVFLTALTLGSAAGAQSKIVAVRVHGNHTATDDEVKRLAGVAPGDAFAAETKAAVEERLRSSGRFETAEVRVRYLGLDESTDVALVILVREKRSVANRFMAAPILDFSDEYGDTFGGAFAIADVPVEEGKLSFPLSWGGKRQAAVESTIPIGSGRSLSLDLSRWQRENPHFELPDDRLEVGGSFILRRDRATFDARGRWSEVDFDAPEERFVTLGAKLAYDTRRDPTFPGDAFYAALDWRRLFFLETDSASTRPDVGQFVFDLRGYKRLVGKSLVAAQIYWAVSDGSMPPYEQPFLGGGMTLRGSAPGKFIGDNAALGSVELRLPLTKAASFVRAGVHAFYDVGAVYDDGASLAGASFHHGVGLGAFFRVAFIGARVDLGLDLEGGTRVHVESRVKF